MEAIGCLVPELRSEAHRECGMQVFEIVLVHIFHEVTS